MAEVTAGWDLGESVGTEAKAVPEQGETVPTSPEGTGSFVCGEVHEGLSPQERYERALTRAREEFPHIREQVIEARRDKTFWLRTGSLPSQEIESIGQILSREWGR